MPHSRVSRWGRRIYTPPPKALDAATECLLRAYVEAFSDYGLSINWSKGKPEALLAYRGRNASRCLDARRSSTGDIHIKVPGCPGKSLHVVRSYKHLGGIIATKCRILPEALSRASSAMTAYFPFAGKVFGAKSVSVHMRLCLMRSLVLSRLF